MHFEMEEVAPMGPVVDCEVLLYLVASAHEACPKQGGLRWRRWLEHPKQKLQFQRQLHAPSDGVKDQASKADPVADVLEADLMRVDASPRATIGVRQWVQQPREPPQ
mmetsp:Transcript_16473/g.37990  ORF Transcript_16473/g.37990 Transcript_16473/m.37990 type:complete len:107 (-) Transcript_16473:105-425(-)